MIGAYLGILVLAVVAATLSLVLVGASWLLGPRKNTPYKSAPYECGVAPVGDAKERFPIKFYLVAILFILFDIEAVFLWGFYVVYGNQATEPAFISFAFFAFMVYIALWVLGDVYAIRSGALEWDEATSLAPEKLKGREPREVESVTAPQHTMVGIGGGTK